MNLLPKLFELAQHVQPCGRARVCAAVTLRGRIIGLGINSRKTHPLQQEFGEYPYLHAEIAAIVAAHREMVPEVSPGRVWHRNALQGCVLWVARAKRQHPCNCSAQSLDYHVCGKKYDAPNGWIPGLAKPCPACEAAAKAFGIMEVRHT